jgi:hypothetical protein
MYNAGVAPSCEFSVRRNRIASWKSRVGMYVGMYMGTLASTAVYSNAQRYCQMRLLDLCFIVITQCKIGF